MYIYIYIYIYVYVYIYVHISIDVYIYKLQTSNQVQKGMYDADFEEAFGFNVADATGTLGDMTVKVLDWRQ